MDLCTQKVHGLIVEAKRQFQHNMASAVIDIGTVLVMVGFSGGVGGGINIEGLGV